MHCNYVDLEAPEGHNDSMIDPSQRIWGFESNFGGMSEIAMVKANQLMPKPTHMTWEEAACLGLVSSTSYRMLVGNHGANMKQGDVVLIWGATGGLGGFAVPVRAERRRCSHRSGVVQGEGRDPRTQRGSST